ncbi:MAG TPA: hypothetical protein VMY98_04515 [Anaerolineae bacterium]|nr:hypothetical protein [Anaerolineae bacterium]
MDPNGNLMDAAATRAHERLNEGLAAMTEEERKGAEFVFSWLTAWYRTAGYKRLCRPIVNKGRQ